MIIGAITASFTDYISSNQEFQDFAYRYGIGDLTTPADFIALMAGVMGVLLVLQATVSLRHGWEDESDGRLQLLQALPVTRSGWLGAEVGTSLGGRGRHGPGHGLATWMGVVVGGADLTLGQSVEAIANVIPVLLLFVGLAVLLHGVAPRLATPVSAGLRSWPTSSSSSAPPPTSPTGSSTLSPFRHLARFPPAR